MDIQHREHSMQSAVYGFYLMLWELFMYGAKFKRMCSIVKAWNKDKSVFIHKSNKKFLFFKLNMLSLSDVTAMAESLSSNLVIRVLFLAGRGILTPTLGLSVSSLFLYCLVLSLAEALRLADRKFRGARRIALSSVVVKWYGFPTSIWPGTLF